MCWDNGHRPNQKLEVLMILSQNWVDSQDEKYRIQLEISPPAYDLSHNIGSLLDCSENIG